MSTQTGEGTDDLGLSRRGSTDRMDICTLGRQRRPENTKA